MDLFLQRVFDGMNNGAIYAIIAMAVVIVFKASGILNFAQGEMAMFSTYIAYVLSVDLGLAIWLAIGVAVILSMGAGAAIERVLIRPLEKKSVLATVVVPVGLFILLHDLAGGIWTAQTRGFPSPFPNDLDDFIALGDARLRYSTIGTWVVVLATFGAIVVLFKTTRIGLAFRCVSSNRESSRLAGIPLGRTLMFGWALAAGVGTLGGALAANTTLLHPNMMLGVIIYAMTAAAVGGFDSIGGAVIGGILVGLAESLVAGYVGFIGSELRIASAMVILVAVLLFRPQGLFGTRTVERV